MKNQQFKFIHSADLHLDSPFQGLQKSCNAPVEKLRGATRKALENLLSLAIREQVEFVLIAGDVYDGDWQDYQTGLFFRRQMLELQKHGIEVYLIHGNHDAKSEITRHIRMPANVHTFASGAAESKQHRALPITIHGRSFPSRAVENNFAISYPQATNGHFNIGLLHTSLVGSNAHDTYAPCSESDLASKDYNYWALGHIHIPQIVNRQPYIVYSGNTQGRHVREAGERGCWLVSVESDHAVELEYKSLDVVRWASVEVDISGVCEEADIDTRVADEVMSLVQSAGGRLVALRVILVGKTTLHHSLHANEQQFFANITAALQEFGDDKVWLEKVVFKTTREQALESIAERNVLSAAVIGSVRKELESAPLANSNLEQSTLPKEVRDMLKLLPADVNRQVLDDLQGDSGAELMNEVQALVLASLDVDAGEPA